MNGTVLLDSNLLVLFMVGATDPALISHHKRTDDFGESDFDLLAGILGNYQTLLSTPNILTETSNHLQQVDNETAYLLLAKLADSIEEISERHVPSRTACALKEFSYLGLADAAIIHCAAEADLVLTTDGPLVGALMRLGLNAREFDWLREARDCY